MNRDPPGPYNPQCLSRLLIHACVEDMASLLTSPSLSPSLSFVGPCLQYVSSCVPLGMKRIKLFP